MAHFHIPIIADHIHVASSELHTLLCSCKYHCLVKVESLIRRMMAELVGQIVVGLMYEPFSIHTESLWLFIVSCSISADGHKWYASYKVTLTFR